MRANRLAGHTLPREGRLLASSGRYSDGRGRTQCSCGERSPLLDSTYARKKWHREHKDKIRGGRSHG